MVQIDIPMPTSCDTCPFCVGIVHGDGMDGFNKVGCFLMTKMHADDCPLQEAADTDNDWR